MKYLKLIPK